MNSKERVLTTVANKPADRVPINYLSNPGIDGRLKEHFTLDAKDDEGLLKALGVDFRNVEVPFIGEKKHADMPNRGVFCDEWGVRRKKVENESGFYWDFCDFPLKDATVEEVAAWPMPTADDYDYSKVE